MGAILSRYESKWIRGKCERLANSGVFRSVSQVYAIGHIRLPELIKIQCFKGESQVVYARPGIELDLNRGVSQFGPIRRQDTKRGGCHLAFFPILLYGARVEQRVKLKM